MRKSDRINHMQKLKHFNKIQRTTQSFIEEISQRGTEEIFSA